MRLTLRTLLAYRDGVLTPSEHDDLHRRIQQNPDAVNLLRRVNELVASREILSPPLEAGDLSAANIIAEYLDDTLTSQRVVELERLCLQHSEHLCELAHCHQLLSEAIRSRVGVPDSLRELALRLNNSQQPARGPSSATQPEPVSSRNALANSAHDTTVPAQPIKLVDSSEMPGHVQVNVEVPMMASGGGTIRHAGLNLEGASLSREVPEYLRGSRKSKWQLPTAIAGLLVVAILTVLQSLGSLEELRLLWQTPAVADSSRSQSAQATASSDASKVKTTALAEPTRSGDKPTDNVQSGEAIKSEESATTSTSAAPPSLDTQASNASPAPSAASNAQATDDSGESTKTEETSEADSSLSQTETAGKDSNEPPPPPGEVESPDVIHLGWSPSDNVESQATLLSRQPGGTWQSLALNVPLALPVTTLSAPTCRSTIELAGWKATLSGASVIEWNAHRGQIQLTTGLMRGLFASQSLERPLQLSSPSGDFEVTLLSQTAWLGMEVGRRAVRHGSVAQSDTTTPVTVIVVISDDSPTDAPLLRVRRLPSGQTIEISQTGSGVAALGGDEPIQFVLSNPPRWYGKRWIRPIDQIAHGDLQNLLQQGTGPVADQLLDLAADSRPEVSALAIQLSLLTGNWQPFVTVLLTEDRLRGHWSTSIALARQLWASNSAMTGSLRTALDVQFGPDARRIYDLLGGLSQDQLSTEGLLGLVKGLESPTLAVRLLSAYELTELTGVDNGYLPHAPVRALIQQYRQQLANGKLTIRPVGDPIWERTGLP
ncbi:MAG: hypothetical protein KF752_14425 [Pirellulaceae bacterium]|nr:hypothetical protein [Pirellulaceae bacterium]